jgi:hypothetical protein
MAPKLARMAERVVMRAAADDRRGVSEALEGGLAGMTETAMPGGRGRGGHERARTVRGGG